MSKDQAFFPVLAVADSIRRGDSVTPMCDAELLRMMSLSVLKCLHLTISDEGTKDGMSLEEISDVVACAGGLLELAGAVFEGGRE